MSDRIANIIVLCEDQEQQNLVRRYLIRTNHETRSFRFQPLPGAVQCGSQYVRERFRDQVAACRGILGRRASCLLIVVTDADNLSVREREESLRQQLKINGDPDLVDDEPVVIFIPKWQIETWIKCLLGQQISEEDRDSDKPAVSAEEIKAAAETLYDWTRQGVQPGPTCVDSLRIAIPGWRRIG